ncbi:MAG: hypothetical protein M1812_007778 [Candelaria pacifica]|nr:MAG: hypothetical protein M1812_007778 [Candelaria pacifica]
MSSENVDVPSNGLAVYIPCIIFCVLSPLMVGARFWTRIRSSKTGWDDWTILASMMIAFTVSVLLLVMIDLGYGKHMKDIPKPTLIRILKVLIPIVYAHQAFADHYLPNQLFWYAQMFYKVDINLTKASILLLYLRIFTIRKYRIACYVLLVLVSCFGTALAFSAIFQCTPIARAWNKSYHGTCIDLTKSWYANAGFSIGTDTLILILPMPVIYALRMPAKQKIGLMLLLALGAFVLVTSIMRATTLDNSKAPDVTWTVAISIWTVIEANVGIICACLPALSKPLATLFPRLKWFFAGHPSTQNTAKFTSASNSYSSNAYGKNNLNSSNDTSNSESWVELESKAGNKRKMSMGVPRDSDEESLYGMGHGKEGSEVGVGGMGGIVKTTEFSLQHELDDGGSNSSADKHTHIRDSRDNRSAVVPRGDQQV